MLPACAAEAVGRDSEEKGLPFLNATTFPVFYRGALQELALAAGTLTRLLENDEAGETLPALTTACITFQLLIELLKAHHDGRGVRYTTRDFPLCFVFLFVRETLHYCTTFFFFLIRVIEFDRFAGADICIAIRQGGGGRCAALVPDA